MSSLFFELDTIEMFDFLIKTSKVCVLNFSAKWCGPCKKFTPLLEQTVINSVLKHNTFYNTDNFTVSDGTTHFTGDVHKLKNSVTFLKIDIDKFSDLANAYKIKSVPTILFYANGEHKQVVPTGSSLSDRANNIVSLVHGFLSN